jgi:hypothetical protein
VNWKPRGVLLFFHLLEVAHIEVNLGAPLMKLLKVHPGRPDLGYYYRQYF